jgi:ribosomal protein S12 methylthiotransferase
MNRRTTKEEILSLIARIRTIIPNVAIRTSLIVGFPGETDEEFQELVEFVKTVRFNRLGVFKYSQEEGTSAFNLTGQVPEKVKQSRFNTIMKLQKSISFQLNKLFIGKQLDILIEEKSEDGFLGRTEFDAPEIDGAVYIKTKNKFKIGQIVKGKIIDALEYDLIAEVK